MRKETTYKITYDGGKRAWLSIGRTPSEFKDVSEVVEVPVVIADEGKTLVLDGEDIGCFSTLDGRGLDQFTEIDLPPPEEEEEVEEPMNDEVL